MTEILHPDNVGSLTNLATSGCVNNFDCVDDVIADDDASYVIRASNSFATDVYSMANSSVGSGTIDSVAVYCRARLTQLNSMSSSSLLNYFRVM